MQLTPSKSIPHRKRRKDLISTSSVSTF